MINIIHFTLPTHLAGALINGDEGGLDKDDIKALNQFMLDNKYEYGYKFDCIDVDESGEGFCKFHDMNSYGVLACDCSKYAFTY